MTELGAKLVSVYSSCSVRGIHQGLCHDCADTKCKQEIEEKGNIQREVDGMGSG